MDPFLGTPWEPPEQPLPSSDSGSAREAAQSAPLGSFGDQLRGRCGARLAKWEVREARGQA
eukprot:10998558-Alexandrium_andersonii.AAC.1